MIGIPLTILDEVDSSNNYAIAQATQGLAQHGAAFLAKHQTAGKGQRGKLWRSESGKNIAISVLLNMSQAAITQQFILSSAVALAVFDVFSKYALDDTRIKWPNDIYWRDRKAVGILLENTIKGQKWQWAVAGIGMNVNQTIFDEMPGRRAVSLKQITGRHFDCAALATELCAALDIRFQQFSNGETQALLAAYNTHLFRKDTVARLKYEGEMYDCIIKEVDAQGRLWVANGPLAYFTFGQVEWVF